MDNSIKDEFKDFISTLSTEICKEVLLEDLKNINNSFNETSVKYNTLSSQYINNIKAIQEQLIQLQNTNKKLDGFIVNVDSNNEKVSKALNVIDGGNKRIIDSIIADNQKLFQQYSEKIQALNDIERRKFITALISSMGAQSEKYIEEIKAVANGSKIEEILKSANSSANNINSINNQVKEVAKSLINSEKKTIEEINKKIEGSENKIDAKIDEINRNVINISNELNYKIAALNAEINKKNKIIIILTSLILVFQYLSNN